MDFYIRESLHNADKDAFYPEYGIEDDRLTMQIGRMNTGEASREF